MLKITFYPDYEVEQLLTAAHEYQAIWDREGNSITEKLRQHTTLDFVETHINAVVFEGISHSYPLCFRASLESNLKKSNIIHELSHRLVSGNYRANKLLLLDEGGGRDLETHKQIYLFYYDVLCDLYGEEYAQNVVVHETNPKRPESYKQAWDWALSKTPDDRKTEFKKLLSW